MNSAITNISLRPSKALIIYETKESYNKKYYIESRQIKNVAGKLQLTMPMPLSENVLKQIAKTYTKQNTIEISHGFIPVHMLYGKSEPGKTITMWYRPAMKRKLNFSASLEIKGSSEVSVPATLYIVINNKLNIYALSSDLRPDMETKIYNAPYFNIYEDGNVCLGSAQIGKHRTSSFADEAERFERAFYLAQQNHGHNANLSKSDTKKLWTSLIKSKKEFPISELVAHKKYKTLNDIMDKLIGGNKYDYYEED